MEVSRSVHIKTPPLPPVSPQVYAWGCGACLGCGSSEATALRPKLIEELATTRVVDISIGDSHCLALSHGNSQRPPTCARGPRRGGNETQCSRSVLMHGSLKRGLFSSCSCHSCDLHNKSPKCVVLIKVGLTVGRKRHIVPFSVYSPL